MLTATQLEERRGGIGGSDIAAIMCLSPWKTPFQVYQEKRKEVDDWQGNESTDWGSRLEPTIRQWYSDITGRVVRIPENILSHKKYPFIRASLDGFTDDERVVEIKTARSGKGWGDPGTDEIPEYYALQVQHYMLVTGFEVSDIPVSIAGKYPEIYEVPADKELQEMIIEACINFWKRVVDGDPPEPVTYSDAVARFGRSTSRGTITATEIDIANVNDLRQIRAEIKTLQGKEEEYKGEIIKILGDNGDILADLDGCPLVTYKLSKGRKSFDSKQFQIDEPKIYEKYVKCGEGSRRFLIKGE